MNGLTRSTPLEFWVYLWLCLSCGLASAAYCLRCSRLKRGVVPLFLELEVFSQAESELRSPSEGVPACTSLAAIADRPGWCGVRFRTEFLTVCREFCRCLRR